MRAVQLLPTLVRFLVALLALVWSSTAHADSEETLPRDVNVQGDSSTVKLPSLPGGFERLDDGWLVLEAPSSVHDRVEPLVREAEEFRTHLSEDLGQPVLDHVLVRIAHSPEEMAALAPEGQPPPPYAAGVAYPPLRVVLLTLREPVTWDAPDLSALLRHELTHVALGDAVSNHHVPRWFNEGLAIRESGELPWARSRTLWDASLSKRLLPLGALDQGFPSDGYDVNIAYAESADFVNFLMRDTDRVRFGSLVERVRGGTDFGRALEDAYGTDVRKLEYEWREAVDRRFGLVPMLTGGGLLWTLIVGLAGAAWFKKRRRAKAKLAQWAREEAEMDSATLATDAARHTPGDEELPPRVPSLPVVEHEGRWYTVH
jgi:hypothetical protein